MRRLLWMVIFFGGYVWVMTSGHQQLVMDQGKKVYQALIAWFDDADVDFQLKEQSKARKKSRRWD